MEDEVEEVEITNFARYGVLEIPEEIWIHVFSFLSVATNGKVCQVCQYFRRLASDDSIWTQLYMERFPYKKDGIYLPKRRFKFNFETQKRIEDTWKNNRFTSTVLETSHSKTVLALEPDFRNRRLFSGSSDKTIKIWNTDTYAPIHMFKGHRGGVECLKVDATGTRLVSGSDHKHVLIFDIEEATILGKLKGHTQAVHDLAIRNDMILSGGRDNVIKLWDSNSFKFAKNFRGHTNSVCCIRFLDDNQFISGGVDCVVKLWDIRKGQCVKDLAKTARPVRAMKVFGNNLLFGGEDRALSVLDLSDNTLKKKIDIKNYLLCMETCDFGLIYNLHHSVCFFPWSGTDLGDISDLSTEIPQVKQNYLLDKKEDEFWVNDVVVDQEGKKVFAAAGPNLFVWDAVGKRRPASARPRQPSQQ